MTSAPPMTPDLFAGLPAHSALVPTPCSAPSRESYKAECEQRWGGEALRDAKQNWHSWQELHDDLLAAMRQYHRNPFLEDVSGKCHNPDGTLTALLWKMQEAWQPDKSCLHPLLDFEEHFQKVFLRRGLIIYCSMLLRQMEPNDQKLSHAAGDSRQPETRSANCQA